MESNRVRLRVTSRPSQEYIEDALRRARLVQAGRGKFAQDTNASLKKLKKWKDNK